MLPLMLVTLVLFALGCFLIARVAIWAVARLGLDPWETLEWFGIAESPTDQVASQRPARVIPLRRGAHPV